jgi:TM2 domain-containing membrane protein YozV/cold shock CspA family protein
MRGQIFVFNEQKEVGAIATSEGQRMLFHISDWQDVVPPEKGMAVEFTLEGGNRARLVQMALPETIAPSAAPQPAARLAPTPKRKPVLTLWAIFLGMLGAHRFYMGAWGWGLVQLLGLLLIPALLALLLPALGGLLYVAVVVFTWVEVIRYIWMSDAAFDAKVKAYHAQQPGPFAFFW